jgi:hypothetical protein
MYKAFRVTVTAAIGIVALSLAAPAHAGSSDVGAGLVGFGIGAILGSALAPQAVYVAPPTACLLRATTAACLLRASGLCVTGLSI